MDISNTYFWRTLRNEIRCNQNDIEVHNVFLCVVESEKINIYAYDEKINYKDILIKCINSLKYWAEEASAFDKPLLQGRFSEAAKSAEYSKKFVDNQLKIMGMLL